jgi:hypothetical protein
VKKASWVIALCCGIVVATTGGASAGSELESLSGKVAAVERRIAELERQVTPLLVAPAPTLPEGGAPVPLYLGGGSELPQLDEHKRLDVRHLMLVELERGGITWVDYDDGTETKRFAPPWQKAGFVIAPVEVLIAIRAAAMDSLKGVELDLRVRTEARGVHYVTLTHELDGSLHVLDLASPNDSLPPADGGATEADLRKRFGIGKLDGGGGRWAPVELESLARALEMLSGPERARLAGLELRRESRPQRVIPTKGSCGVTVVDRIERWIEIYDCAFRDDDIVFAGNPRAPERASVRLILHELGHALSTAPVLDFNRALQKLADDGKQTATECLAWRDKGPVADQRAIDEMAGRLAAVAARLQSLARRIAEERPAGPIVAAFSRVPGASAGVTRYGRESPSEAFAEGFSLFRADPDALHRVSPAALEFFEKGRQLGSR